MTTLPIKCVVNILAHLLYTYNETDKVFQIIMKSRCLQEWLNIFKKGFNKRNTYNLYYNFLNQIAKTHCSQFVIKETHQLQVCSSYKMNDITSMREMKVTGGSQITSFIRSLQFCMDGEVFFINLNCDFWNKNVCEKFFGCDVDYKNNQILLKIKSFEYKNKNLIFK